MRPGPWLVAGGTVTDSPRFGWRGAMLDVSRHFFSVDEVKRYIDRISLYKINKLHLHLSDDQGWRIAIDSWPRLATYGGSTEVGGGPGGYYTKDDYREIVRYAASRYLEVVPEIDMPGHTNAALASYSRPELRRRRAPALHRHPGRLQLAVRRQGDHVRLRRGRGAGDRRAHARPLPPHRRRRGALHAARGVRGVHGAGPAGRRPVRQDGGGLAPADRGHPGEGGARPVLGSRRHECGREGPGRAGRAERHRADPLMRPTGRTWT